MVFLKVQIPRPHLEVLTQCGLRVGNCSLKSVSWLIAMQMFLDFILRITGLKVGTLICSFSQFVFLKFQ